MLRVISTDGPRLFIEAGDWNQREGFGAWPGKRPPRRQGEQLEHMIDYAESNLCRRQIILDHFADPGSADAARCCDNCSFDPALGRGL